MSNVHVEAVEEPSPEQPGEGSFVVGTTPVPAPSPLDGLKAKLAATELTTDLEVPRWPEIFGFHVYVRYSPLSPARMAKNSEDFQKTKAEDWSVQAAAQSLVDCCQGVYVIDPKDPEHKISMRPGDPDGPWTKFDHELREQLGVTEPAAIAVVRTLYRTDGDVLAAAGSLMEWSTQGPTEDF